MIYNVFNNPSFCYYYNDAHLFAALRTQSVSPGLLRSLPGKALLLLAPPSLLCSLHTFSWTISLVDEDHLMASVTNVVSLISVEAPSCQVISVIRNYST